MRTGDPHLLEILRAEVAARGSVSFAWFMEQALYHPEDGYYGSGKAAIGRDGDYFTNVSVGPLFGRLLETQFAEMWEALERPDDFAIVEQGAHGGEFAHDVLSTAQQVHPKFFAALRYVIVEPSHVLREQQKTRLAAFGAKVCWQSSLDELAPFRGAHFSNELLDAMPVHRVRWNGEEWKERRVAEEGGTFVFVDRPIADNALSERLRTIPLPLPAGYETEVNLAARKWIETLAPELSEGFVLAVDYGWPRDQFYAPDRTTGTLRCYRDHRIVASPLSQPGQVDITAHVEWTSLIEHARACGLTYYGLTDQHHFITGLLAAHLDGGFATSGDQKTNRALQTLLHPSHLGMKFQFLVLGKNARAPVSLSGLHFARPEPLK